LTVLVVFVVYLVVMAAIGAYCVRFNRSLADFVLGGRRLGPWVAALSPATAYAQGLSALWAAVGCGAGTVFNWLVIAPRLRRESEKHGALTIPDYLAARFPEGRVRLVLPLAVGVILLAYATYIASQFIAAGKIFQTTLGQVGVDLGSHPYHVGMLVGVGIILLYTALGGFMAVAWTDLLQGILMVTTVVVLPIVGLVGLGGLAVLWGRLEGANAALLGLAGAKGASGLAFWMGVVAANLSWGLGYPGQPHILARFMALRDPREMRRAALIGITWVILAMWGAIFVGLVGRAIFGNLADPDHVMPRLALRLVHPVIAGTMIAAAMAAIMSTYLGGHPGDRAAVWIGRLTVLVLGALALPIAWNPASVYNTVFNAWGVLAAGLGPVVCLGLLSRRTNRWGAAVGMFVGMAVAQLWPEIKPLFGRDLLFRNGLIPGFFLNLALAYLVSLATPTERTRQAR